MFPSFFDATSWSRRLRLRTGIAAWLLGTGLCGRASAELEDAELSAPSTEFAAPSSQKGELRLDSSPGWAAGIDGYGGLALLATSARTEAHAVAGALARARIGYVQLGGVIEQSDRAESRWRAIGGFAGAFLPYRNWVDLDFALGLAFRTYQDSDTRYGPGGYDVTSPSLVFRAGFSDRSTARLLGARLGAHLVGMFDLARHDEPWTYELAQPSDVISGSTRVGGHSMSVVLSAGFDLLR